MLRFVLRSVTLVSCLSLACGLAVGCDSKSEAPASCEAGTPCECPDNSSGIRVCADAGSQCECAQSAGGAAGTAGTTSNGGAGTAGGGSGGTAGAAGTSGSAGTSTGGVSAGGASGAAGAGGADPCGPYLETVDCTGEDACGYVSDGCSITCAEDRGEILLHQLPARVHLGATPHDPSCCDDVQRMYWITLDVTADVIFPKAYYSVNAPWRFAHKAERVDEKLCVVTSSDCGVSSYGSWVAVYTDDPNAPPADVIVEDHPSPGCF